MPPLTRAAIAHLYFVTIHPFEDGNGRLGRALAEMALAQGLGHPTLLSLADAMKRRQKAYYHVLEATNKPKSSDKDYSPSERFHQIGEIKNL